ncbi:MAG: hypothetical protein RH862_17120 [Leptospiraceae bacterium]
MICPTCQSESSVHIFDPQAGQMMYYCQTCKKAIIPENSIKCPGCGISEYSFLSNGLCGCEDCYSVFRGSIIQGIESYRKSIFQKAGRYRVPGRNAMARLQTYFEIMKEQPDPEQILPTGADSWSDAPELGPDQVQIRVRMARNVPGLSYRDGLKQTENLRRIFLSDRGFLSGLEWPENNRISQQVAVGDEDHFRFSWSWVSSGDLAEAERHLGRIIRQIRKLDRAFVWQYSTIFGFLTGCPTNSGSGLRMSARVRIPALLEDPSWLRWKKELHRAGFEVRPGSGEKSFPDGQHIQLATRHISGPAGFRSVLERFRIYLARLMVREQKIGEKILAHNG